MSNQFGYAQGQMVGGSALGSTKVVAHIDSAVNTVGNQCEQASLLVNRLESLAVRLFGNAETPKDGGNSAPQPVRPCVMELEHRQSVLSNLLSRAGAVLARIEDL
jgi:hypothetical protein